MHWHDKSIAMRVMATSMMFTLSAVTGCVAASEEDPSPGVIGTDAGSAGGCLSTNCSALSVTPTKGKQKCDGACLVNPDPTDVFKCVTSNGVDRCVPVRELFCDDGIDEDLDGVTDCNDSDCAKHTVCQSGCGNNKVDTGEDCDGGNGCLQGCKCPAGQIADGSGGCKTGSCTPKCQGLVCGSDGCGGNCGTCKSDESCKNDQTACLPGNVTPTKDEACDNGVDDDGDGKVDVSDPDCAAKTVASLGIYFGSACTLHIKSGDGETWDGNVPGNFTLSVKIDGNDKDAKIWIENCTSVSATSPQGFTVWQNAAVKYPNWPTSSVQALPVPKGGSFAATPSTESTFNLYLQGSK